MRPRLLASALLLAAPFPVYAQSKPKPDKKAAAKPDTKKDAPLLPPETQAKIVALSQAVLSRTGVPSASVGVVQGGKVVYVQAFGAAQVSKPVPATSEMAYPIGSISKQFTAAALLLLQQDGKLQLSDPVGKYFPELTRAGDVTILNLLTHTSGYQDDAPLDYIPPALYKAVAPLEVAHTFAGKPLDFEPGTQWQYSNTGFIVATLIVEKVAGEPLDKLLAERVFKPLEMTDVFNTYQERDKLKVTGYMSNGMAPVRELPLEAQGWYYGDGDLAMSAGSLLKWDLSVMNQTLLKPESYTALETAFKLKDGKETHYGLGLDVLMRDGHRELEHGGEVGGFVAENVMFPDDNTAVVVLTNEVASDAAGEIAKGITDLLLPRTASAEVSSVDPFEATLRTILAGLQLGAIDRSLYTADANAYFTPDVLGDFKIGLGRRGAISKVEHGPERLRGGLKNLNYQVTFADGTKVNLPLYFTPDGKIEQLLVVNP